VKTDDTDREEHLRDDEKALVYGGGIIANTLLAVFISGVFVATIAFKAGFGATVASNIPLVGGLSTWVVVAVFGLFALLLLQYARLICRFIFPLMGLVMFAAFIWVLWMLSKNLSLLGNIGFIGLADQTQQASASGLFFVFVGYISLTVGLGNLLPLHPLDGGQIAMIHMQGFGSKFKLYYEKLGLAIVIFLLVFQFVPDLYRLFM
jgi:hypothetical protein